VLLSIPLEVYQGVVHYETWAMPSTSTWGWILDSGCGEGIIIWS